MVQTRAFIQQQHVTGGHTLLMDGRLDMQPCQSGMRTLMGILILIMHPFVQILHPFMYTAT